MAGDEVRRERIISRALSGYGLLDLPLDRTIDAFTAAAPQSGWTHAVAARDTSLEHGLDFLDALTVPATRYVMLAVTPHWTAVLNNLRSGFDFADDQRRLRPSLRTRSIRVVDRPSSFTVCNGYRERTGYAARIVTIYDGDTLCRSIACADDGGRWTFDAAGTPLEVEDRFDHTARTKSRRLTSENLAAVLDSIGAPRVEAADLERVHGLALLTATSTNADRQQRIDETGCTVAQADDPAYGYLSRAQGWTEHFSTHASSVVVDLTKALLLNPDYEPLARPTLDRARRQLGAEHYGLLVEQARRSLNPVDPEAVT